MLVEQQQQAKNLYFQTNLSKTQIADLLRVSRRSLHYWIRENDWDRLKKSSALMPSLIAEDCYHIMANLSKHLLSETRITSPITHQEADTLHKLTITVNKLKNRSTLNESMEMFAFFMEGVSRKSPEMAEAIAPFVEDYITSRASVHRADVMPENFNRLGFIPVQKEDNEEAKLDLQEIAAWTDTGNPIVDIEQFRTIDEANPGAPVIAGLEPAARYEAEAISQNTSYATPVAPITGEVTAQNTAKRPAPLPVNNDTVQTTPAQGASVQNTHSSYTPSSQNTSSLTIENGSVGYSSILAQVPEAA